MGRDSVFQEPGAADRGRDREWIFCRGARTAGEVGIVVGRAFYGGWDDAGGMGEPAEFSGEGGSAEARQRVRRRAAAAGHARVPDRPAGAAVSQVQRGGGGAVLS